MTRKTIQQRLVLEAAQRMRHPSAEEIYQAIVRKHPNISRGTVYRNLHNLTASDVLGRVLIPGGAERFDATTPPHYHAVCKLCGAVQDAALPYQDRMQDAAAACDGFVLEKHDIIFWGICKECATQIAAQKDQVEEERPAKPTSGG
ncbi:MAG: transcriptional repressor [Treponema sp.]|nr:transcriptional repressor [Treponema sp.]